MLLVVIFLFKISSKCSAKVLSIGHKCKMAVTGLAESESDKFHSCISYRDVGVSSVLMNQRYIE